MTRINIPNNGLWGTIAGYLNTMLTELYNALSSSTVIVRSSADLVAIDSTKLYVIDGIVDMGSASIEIPIGGMSIASYGQGISKLISSSPNLTLFTSPVGGSGSIRFKDVAFNVSGAGSRVYNITDSTGANSIELINVNYENCSSLGVISGFNLCLEENTRRFGGSPELTLDGNWAGGFFISISVVRSTIAGAYPLFKAGPSFTMQSRFNANFNVDLNAGNSLCDFSDANFPNPSTLQFQGTIVSRLGVVDSSDALLTPNITADNLSCAWKGNTGLSGTFQGAKLTVTAEQSNAIAAQDTFEDIAGTFTASDLQHYASSVNGQVEFLGVSPEEYRITCVGVVAGVAGENVTLKVVRFRASDSAFIDVAQQTVSIVNAQGAADMVSFVFLGNTRMQKNDYLKLQIANNSSASSATVLSGSAMYVGVR